ncbi:MAG TPA: SRPBCC family protein [Acidimicrobiia bacterium]|jgi:uncharacterized protein YndB with AHSA1/START domain|nr:SRPBCC family protein [Acidimicrobiia bacterium]
MPVNEIEVDAPPEVVWAVLADPPTYSEWVVGNKAVRDHDRQWPDPGTEFHHKVGFGPIAVKDKTVSMAVDAPRRLVMNVRALPVGHGVVTFAVAPAGPMGSAVRMEEYVLDGPAKVVWPLVLPLVKLRNFETLRRLKRCAEARYRAAVGRER